MESSIDQALNRGGVADIITTGRKTGQARRTEITFMHLGGDYYITGHPGRKRDWLANMGTHPDFTLHLKRDVTADVPARARVITESDEREAVLRRILSESWDNPPEKVDHIIGRWVAEAPLVQFEVAG